MLNLLKFTFVFMLLFSALRVQAESKIIENIKRVLPVGTYEGSNPSGVCSVEVVEIENGLVVTVLENGAILDDVIIDKSKTLSFPFTSSDIDQVIAEDFSESVAFLEYNKLPEDQTSGSFVRRLNITGSFVSLLEKRNGLFGSPKSLECEI